MNMEKFIMIISDNYSDMIQTCYPSFSKSRMRKNDFRIYCDYRWAIDTMIKYVHDYLGETDPNGLTIYPVLKFYEAVVQFEYDMTLFSMVQDGKREIFEHASELASDMEDILNAIF